MQSDDSIEKQVIGFTAAEVGVKPIKVRLQTRLAQDLGLEGDDAVEFFEKFAEQFKVDLQDLHLRWDLHFLPEGTQMSLGAMIVFSGCGVAGVALGAYVGILPDWIWIIVLIGIAIFVYQKWFTEDSSIPVTISDLVESARTGRWQKSYQVADDVSPSHN